MLDYYKYLILSLYYVKSIVPYLLGLVVPTLGALLITSLIDDLLVVCWKEFLLNDVLYNYSPPCCLFVGIALIKLDIHLSL